MKNARRIDNMSILTLYIKYYVFYSEILIFERSAVISAHALQAKSCYICVIVNINNNTICY